LIFVDDMLGSGTRTRIFTDAVYRDPTIKSWTSYRFIDAAVAAYAATEEGERKVLSRNRLVKVVSMERRPEGDANWWDEPTRRAIRSLCRRYAKRAKLDWRYAHGVGGAQGTLIFEHACTNVLPAIFWMTSEAWQPLFPNRTIPLDMRPLFRNTSPSGVILGRLRKLGYKKIEERERAAAESLALGVEMAAFLGAAARLRSTKRIAPFLGITFSECEALADSARQRGFLDEASLLTELGRAELARLRREAPRENKNLPSNEERIYIPGQLRVT